MHSSRVATMTRLAPVLKIIFHQCVISCTCFKTEPSELDWLEVHVYYTLMKNIPRTGASLAYDLRIFSSDVHIQHVQYDLNGVSLAGRWWPAYSLMFTRIALILFSRFRSRATSTIYNKAKKNKKKNTKHNAFDEAIR